MDFVSTAPAMLADNGQTAQDSRQERLTRAFAASCDGLYRFILVRVAGDRYAADELLQQTCTIAASKTAIPQGDDELEPWLLGIARNLLRSHWRTQKRDALRIRLPSDEIARIAEDFVSRPLPPDLLVRRELHDMLLQSITLLPSADQDLLFAFYFDGRTLEAIAVETRSTEKALESRLYRIRHRLRELLGAFHEDTP